MNHVPAKIVLAVRFRWVALCFMTGGMGSLIPPASLAADTPQRDDDGTIHLPAIRLPESSFLNEEARKVFKRQRDMWNKEEVDTSAVCFKPEQKDRNDMAAIRRCEAEAYYQSPAYQRLRALYAVTVTPQMIGGVYAEIFVPKDGVTKENEGRVLINVHGGGFLESSRTHSHTESIPIAAVGRFKVMSVDYRQAPEFRFPAATEDVTAVYKELPDLGVSLKPLGDAFIKLVKMIIAPLIFCTVVTGISGLRNLEKVGRVGAKALGYFIVVSTLALLVGLIVANVVQPGQGLHIDAATLDPSAVAAYQTKASERGIVQFLLRVIPDTALGAFASGEILQVLLFSVLFGFGLALMGERGKPLYDVISLSRARSSA